MKVIYNIDVSDHLGSDSLTNFWNIRDAWEQVRQLPLEDQHMLYQDNRKTFAALFGKRTGVFRGEFFHHVWLFDNGFTLMTAKGKGTSLEVPRTVEAARVVEFVRNIIQQIKNYEHTQPSKVT